MFLERFLQNLEQYLKPNKVLVLYGARRVGKTTLVEKYLSRTSYKYKLVSGDNIRVQEVLSSRDFSRILSFCEGYNLLVIDEAQNIPNIGMGLKIIVDQIPDIRVIATGSSSFDLSNKIGEPLVGRKTTLRLFPLSQLELSRAYNSFELKEKLEDWLLFGAYPEVLVNSHKKEKIKILREITESYLLKDILALEKVKNSKTLFSLLKLLALQISGEVSLNELSRNLSIDVKTVKRYLDLLEKSFVIFSLGAFSRNLRKEIYKKEKYYYWDLGLRNAIINNFNDLESRDDLGKIWENFLISERMKSSHYQERFCNFYFWRTYDGQEIDLIEEKDGKIFAFEMKYGSKKRRLPRKFQDAYKNSEFCIINQENYLEFLV